MNRFKIRAQITDWRDHVDFLMLDEDHIVEVSKGKKREPGLYIEPSFSLDFTMAQTLMDDLWDCGIRPTEGTGSAGSLRATERHLEDMRKLVFKNDNRT